MIDGITVFINTYGDLGVRIEINGTSFECSGDDLIKAITGERLVVAYEQKNKSPCDECQEWSCDGCNHYNYKRGYGFY